jgi:hypothetical protein
VAEVIGYNRFYLSFSRILNPTLREQLQSLYNMLSSVSLDINEDGQPQDFLALWLGYGGYVTPTISNYIDILYTSQNKIFLIVGSEK